MSLWVTGHHRKQSVLHHNNVTLPHETKTKSSRQTFFIEKKFFVLNCPFLLSSSPLIFPRCIHLSLFFIILTFASFESAKKKHQTFSMSITINFNFDWLKAHMLFVLKWTTNIDICKQLNSTQSSKVLSSWDHASIIKHLLWPACPSNSQPRPLFKTIQLSLYAWYCNSFYLFLP